MLPSMQVQFFLLAGFAERLLICFMHALTLAYSVTDQANISNNAAVAVLVLICIFVSG